MHRARLTFFAGLSTLLLCVVASSASAQETVELSSSQNDLNNQGVQAIIAGDFAGAEALFKSSLALGDANVTYLNLGRALHKGGQCQAALAAYEQAASAPAVSSPTPDEVAAVLERYRGEVVPAECPGFVTLTCRPRSAEVSIDGDAFVACPDKPVQLAPGEYAIEARFDDQTQSETVTVAGMDEPAVEFRFELKTKEPPIETTPDVVADTPPPVAPDAAPEGISTIDILGYTALGLGVVSLGTAVILETTVLADAVDKSDAGTLTQSDKDSAETLQGVNLGLYIAGGVLVATGVVLLVLPASEPESSVHLVVPWASAEGGGIGYTTRF